MQLRLRSTDPDAIFAELILRITTAPQLFERAAVCLDLSALEQLPEEPLARALMDAIRRAGMLPVGLAFDGTEPLGLGDGTGAFQDLAALDRLPRPEGDRYAAGLMESIDE